MDPDLPPAPKIDGEAMLEVFVHKSMKFPGAPLNNDSPYGDSDRLAALGHKILEAAYTDVLFSQRPMLKAEDMKVSHILVSDHYSYSLRLLRSNRSRRSCRSLSRRGWKAIDGEKRCATFPDQWI